MDCPLESVQVTLTWLVGHHVAGEVSGDNDQHGSARGHHWAEVWAEYLHLRIGPIAWWKEVYHVGDLGKQ